MNSATSLVTQKGLGLAGIAAFGACAACCALPLLAAAGIGGSFLSGVAGLIRPGADLIVAGVVGVGVLGVLGVMAYRTRAARAASCATVCATDGACGCAPGMDGASIFSTPSPRADEPIVCTADLRDKPTVQGQLEGYRAAFDHLLRIERFEGGARWIFANRPGLDAELRNLAEKEHQCCSFFRFDVRAEGDVLVWETTAHESAAKVLDEFARLPERLREQTPGNEAEPIKRSIAGAGLIFAADTPAAK